jgi:hypothetical protein
MNVEKFTEEYAKQEHVRSGQGWYSTTPGITSA